MSLHKGLGFFIQQHVKKASAKDNNRVHLAALIQSWRLIMKDTDIIAQPRYFKQHGCHTILVVGVTNAAEAMRLTYEQDEMRQKINSFLGQPIVHQIHVRIMPLSPVVKKAKIHSLPADETVKKYVEQSVVSIKDKRLQKALQVLGESIHMNKSF